MTTTQLQRPTRSDRIGLGMFSLAGIVIAVWAVWNAVARIVEVLPNHDVTVLGAFAGTMADAPIGPDGAAASVELDRGLITVPSLPGAALAAIVIQQVVLIVAVVGVVFCLLWLIRNILAGQVFSRTNTVLVGTAGTTAVLGYAAVPFFGNMAANGAFATISEHSFNNVIIAVEPFSLIALAFIAALAGTVFAVGDRLQRDTEGLV